MLRVLSLFLIFLGNSGFLLRMLMLEGQSLKVILRVLAALLLRRVADCRNLLRSTYILILQMLWGH